MSKDTGGPAFPVQDAASWQAHGMTLRDYFAAKAMVPILQSAKNQRDVDLAAQAAYAMADAMLAARKEGGAA